MSLFTDLKFIFEKKFDFFFNKLFQNSIVLFWE